MTAVEWFADKVDNLIPFISDNTSKKFCELVEQAKEMEKQQIIDAFWNGDNTDCLSEQNLFEFAEQYYNETYKKTP